MLLLLYLATVETFSKAVEQAELLVVRRVEVCGFKVSDAGSYISTTNHSNWVILYAFELYDISLLHHVLFIARFSIKWKILEYLCRCTLTEPRLCMYTAIRNIDPPQQKTLQGCLTPRVWNERNPLKWLDSDLFSTGYYIKQFEWKFWNSQQLVIRQLIKSNDSFPVFTFSTSYASQAQLLGSSP